MSENNKRLLLIDTCGETAGVALFVGSRPVAETTLPPGKASAEIVGAVRSLLQQAGWELANLDGVGVVSGPGSFTGVRTGLAAAKGLCEAAGLQFAAVSRLEVLADAAMPMAKLVALDAGRGEVYVRDVATGREWLCTAEELVAARDVVVAEERLMERLGTCSPPFCPRLYVLTLADMLPSVLRRLAEGGSDVALADANYVRGEQNIYAKAKVAFHAPKEPE